MNLLNSTEKMLHPVFITIDHNRVNTIGGKLDVSSWKGVWETLDLEIIIACISYPFKYRTPCNNLMKEMTDEDN